MEEVARVYNARKVAYKKQIEDLLDTYSRVLVVDADNVTSNQMHQIRGALRGRAVLLMGKNTMIRFVMTNYAKKTGNPKFAKLADLCKLNVGLVFTNDDLRDVRDILLANRKEASARVGAVAPCDVVVPAGPTALEPTQTSFFQALQIPTKINKGAIEILSDVQIITEGHKCGPSEVALLNKLGIRPFSYGLALMQVYEDGSIFGPAVLDLTADDISNFLLDQISNIASFSMATGYLTAAAIPHLLATAFKNCAAIAATTEYSFAQVKELLEFLADPSKFAVAAGPAVGASSGAAAAAPEPEEEEEEEEDSGFDLFD
jgi:large subunit ribosomal protein LP0